MSTLTPPLSVIEDRLFDPSPALIRRWIDGDPSLSGDDRQALEQDARACFLRDLAQMPDDSDADSTTAIEIDEDAPIPPLIAELHQRRAETRARFAAVRDPEPGQMRLFARAIGPEGPLDSDLNAPLAVLLWRRTPVPAVWEGWVLASETDYASDLDILLEPRDEPYDGLVAMVQIWNKIECYVHPEQPVVGRLEPDRLRTMVAAFAEYVLSDPATSEAAAIPALPGTLIERTLGGGERVLCGTPLGADQDPRHRYRSLYAASAGLLKEIAKQALEAAAEPVPEQTPSSDRLRDIWRQWVDGLRALANELGDALVPVAPAAVMNHGKTASVLDDLARTYRVAGLIQIEWLSNDEDSVLKLRVSRLAEGSVVLRLRLDGDLLEQHTLHAGQPEAIFFIAPEPGLVLEIEDPHGVEYRWTLAS